MRRTFQKELYKIMANDKRVYLLLGDLGYKMFDKHRQSFPDRAYNFGAAEQAMMGAAVGLAQEGKIPFVYSITPFTVFRPYETIRNYLKHERANVKLVGSGRGHDYSHDGFSHWDDGLDEILNGIEAYFPKDKKEIPLIINQMMLNEGPTFISLKR